MLKQPRGIALAANNERPPVLKFTAFPFLRGCKPGKIHLLQQRCFLDKSAQPGTSWTKPTPTGEIKYEWGEIASKTRVRQSCAMREFPHRANPNRDRSFLRKAYSHSAQAFWRRNQN